MTKEEKAGRGPSRALITQSLQVRRRAVIRSARSSMTGAAVQANGVLTENNTFAMSFSQKAQFAQRATIAACSTTPTNTAPHVCADYSQKLIRPRRAAGIFLRSYHQKLPLTAKAVRLSPARNPPSWSQSQTRTIFSCFPRSIQILSSSSCHPLRRPSL